MNDLHREAGSSGTYVLGHSAQEIDRLKAQSAPHRSDPHSVFFREAGIAPGMRVLDVGTGAGDVAFPGRGYGR